MKQVSSSPWLPDGETEAQSLPPLVAEVGFEPRVPDSCLSEVQDPPLMSLDLTWHR